MTYAEARAQKSALETAVEIADAAMRAFAEPYGKGPMGLTPDACKFHPAYRALKADFDRAFRALQDFNAVFCKRFAKEYRAERDAARAAKVAA